MPASATVTELIERLFDGDTVSLELVHRLHLDALERERNRYAQETGVRVQRSFEQVLQELERIEHGAFRPLGVSEILTSLLEGIVTRTRELTASSQGFGEEDTFLPLDDTARRLAAARALHRAFS